MPIPQNISINPDADRRLRRIAVFFGLLVVLLLVLTSFGLSWVNALYHPQTLKDLLTPKLIALNLFSILVVLVPFYAGIYRLYAARLEIGRERVEARAWGEAVAALEPFAAPMQRFLDGTGEAHYLLAQAYLGLGSKQKADTAQAFVRRKKGVWAEKLSPGKGPRGKGATVYSASKQENRPPPVKGKPKRRF